MMNSMNFDSNQAPSARFTQTGNGPPVQESTDNAKIESNKEEETTAPETSINLTDVLCGRGKLSFNHVGNRRFRDVISASVSQYNAAESRLEKAKIVNKIVEEIQASGGRFLRQDEKAGTWHVLNHAQCREKVGHAVRDATSSIEARKKRKLEKEAAQKNVGAAIRARSYNVTTFPHLGGGNANGMPPLLPSTGSKLDAVGLRQDTFSSFATEEASRLLGGDNQLPNHEIFGGFQQQQMMIIQPGSSSTDPSQNSSFITTTTTTNNNKNNTWTQFSTSFPDDPPKKPTTKEQEDNDEQFLAFIDEVLGPPM